LIIYSIYDPTEFYYITHTKLLEEKEVKIIHIFSQKSVSCVISSSNVIFHSLV